ncbi:hypothetical protein FS837_002605 [Tulasnella sp. UAMH 9824]|nr:hypothetical protein FS837_002605 [Tulasnella sp. UAMH 9824]
MTIRDSQPQEDEASGSDERRAEPAQRSGVLKLRGGPKSRPQVQWTDDVVDNEGAGKKKSKICCIYHKPRAFDESSSESSSGSDSESDSSSCRGHNHHHHARSRHNVPIGGSGGSEGGDGGASGGGGLREGAVGGSMTESRVDRGPPNAYEKKGKGKANAS